MFSAADRVLVANEIFYEAMRTGDLTAMDRLWAHRPHLACTHPGRPILTGRAEILESWRQIFEASGGVDIWADQSLPLVTGATALVLCEEHVGGEVLMATNAFAEADGRWRMVSHQAAEMPQPHRSRRS